MRSHHQLLLLDLDGVVIHECRLTPGAGTQILLLHDRLPERLASLEMPVAVLTHRSRREAAHILHAAGLDERSLVGVFAAEDLFLAGMSPRSWKVMAGRGLRKSLILPLLLRRFGAAAKHMAFVDDVESNLDDMANVGLGLAMHAPAAFDASSGLLTTFDFEHVVASLAEPASGAGARRIVLPGIEVAADDWRLTGLDTSRHSGHAFNRMRRLASSLRGAVKR